MRHKLRHSSWATSPFYTMFPLYAHTYVVADVISAQTHAFLTRWYGTQAHHPEIANLLIQGYYSPGVSLPWPEKVRALTGQGPDSAALASQLAGLPIRPTQPLLEQTPRPGPQITAGHGL